jgi:hypothetical protein
MSSTSETKAAADDTAVTHWRGVLAEPRIM